jgi:histidinol-phosphatase (PHP family)
MQPIWPYIQLDTRMTQPILYDSHMHTQLCNHATGEPEAYARHAHDIGLKGIIFTCHAPTENDAYVPHVRMRADQFDDYLALVERARTGWQDRLDVRLGLESDYLPGMEDWLTTLHARAPFDYILGSVHPQFNPYRTAYLNGDPVAFQRTYFDHLAQAAETGLFDCLSHPDLVKNVKPDDWDIDRIMPAVEAALDRIAATGTAMELNTSGLHKRIREMNPTPAILRAMHQRGISVVIGSDSHEPGRVGADFDRALALLDEIGYTHISVYHQRQRHTIAIDAARASLQPAAP